MKILFVSQSFAYPLDAANRKHLYYWLKAVSRDYEVDLVLVEPRAEHLKCIESLPNVKIKSLGESAKLGASQRLRRFAVSVVTGTPATVLVATPAAASEWIRRARDRGEYGAAILFESGMGAYATLLQGRLPTILIKPSVHAVDARQERERRGLFRPRWILEQWIVKRFEGRTCRAATVVCPVNQEDASELVRRYHLAGRVEVVPIGVDVDIFPKRASEPTTKTVAFFGNLEWGANLDAVNWLLREIAPKVLAAHPDAHFRLIGQGGEDFRRSFLDPRLEFTGHVKSIPTALADAAVGVVPVITGTGIRFKLLEMLSLGVPTITTTLGKLGTECVDGKHVLVADDAESFAVAIGKLLSDSNLRQSLSRESAELARLHRWDAIEDQVRKLVNDTILVNKETVFETAVARENLSS